MSQQSDKSVQNVNVILKDIRKCAQNANTEKFRSTLFNLGKHLFPLGASVEVNLEKLGIHQVKYYILAKYYIQLRKTDKLQMLNFKNYLICQFKFPRRRCHGGIGCIRDLFEDISVLQTAGRKQAQIGRCDVALASVGKSKEGKAQTIAQFSKYPDPS